MVLREVMFPSLCYQCSSSELAVTVGNKEAAHEGGIGMVVCVCFSVKCGFFLIHGHGI